MLWLAMALALQGGELRVSDNHRYLVTKDGAPFFWLGDTAWELVHRLDREETERYLEARRRQRFTVIQAAALAEFDGLTEPNRYGATPLVDRDPAKPNEPYWAHVDWVVDLAAKKGLWIGLLPTWGDKWNKKWGIGPVVFTKDNARAYGRWLGARYKDRANLIWILGGDRSPENAEHVDLIRGMAAGLAEGDGGRHLMTFHPQGGATSSTWFHADAWLATNMLQSGHGAKDLPTYAKIAADYAKEPPKPCLDGEPRYEDHPVNWKPEKGWFDEFDVRQAAYWAVFAGAHGHTYGCHDIWQFWTPARTPISAARTAWTDALEFPGANQMRHLRALMESKPFLSRVPDPSLVAEPGTGASHVRATRGDGYAFIYIPTGTPTKVVLGKIAGAEVKAAWFDPRLGTSAELGTFPNTGTKEFTPPSAGRGHDWVLVLTN
jgi:hypothetical protein